MKNKVKNFLIRFFFSLVKRWNKPHNFKDSENTCLIISTTGLGDTLWATPAILALKEKKTTIYLLCTNFGKEILKTNPHIDKIFTFKKPFILNLIPLVISLRKKRIKTVYIFHSSQRLTFPLCALIKAKEIIGYEKNNKGLDFLLTKILKKEKIHEIDSRLKLIGAYPTKKRFMEFFLQNDDLGTASLKKLGLNLNKPIVGIHPGAKDTYKCWPPSYFIKVAKTLSKHFQILITAGLDEQKLAKQVFEKIPYAFLLPSCDLQTFAACINKLDLLITNDTGPMHLACSLKIPVIAPFAPTDPIFCGPVSKNIAIAIKKPITCTPCLKRKCNDAFCMLQISEDEVLRNAIKVLGDKNGQKSSQNSHYPH